MKRALSIVGLLAMISCSQAWCQETIFTLLKKKSRLADEYYQHKNYQAAVSIYEKLYKRDPLSTTLPVKIARSYYFLKEYKKAISAFESKRNHPDETTEDLFYYAESVSATGDYKKAISIYREFLKKKPDDAIITQKIWRLNNIQYLYEDSLHYAVRSISLNTTNGELCAVPYKNGLLYLSNRKEAQIVEKTDGRTGKPFYKTYYAVTVADSIKQNILAYKKATLFGRNLYSGLHAGSMAFYQHQKKMILTSTGQRTKETGLRTLQLFFATEQEGHWEITHSFPFNSNAYSISDPTINEAGTVLYFSSDMKGGFGGKDIYRSYYQNNQWTRPENLGDAINTPYDEAYPFLYKDNTLYFSSNGHPGLGGLDIFKAPRQGKELGEVVNAGYPINTQADEFGITIDSLSTHGYFSSNRNKGGFDDDIFEFDIDLQTYPLEISGWMKYKEFNWSEHSELKVFANAEFFLIDNLRDVIVQHGYTDDTGNFTWTIPYFSKYRIRVVGPENDEHVVSLEIPTSRKMLSKHEVVIVKDAFKAIENQNKK
ncbi:MAG: hypothetical protein DI538_18105 [Azospira oryzae]|nr:MAG: hypothetical protein DI538_18105 [Azospira oryzae]